MDARRKHCDLRGILQPKYHKSVVRKNLTIHEHEKTMLHRFNSNYIAGQTFQRRAQIAEAEERYARRYRTPRPNPSRVVLAVHIDRILGSLPD